jgi:hypothetical protein
MKLWFVISLSLFLSNSLMAMSFQPDLYTEQAYLGRESVIQQTTRLRLYENSSTATGARVLPYVTAGSELIMSGIAQNPLDSGGSYAFGGVGFRLSRGPMAWFNEVRGRGFYKFAPNPKNTHESFDVRSLIVLTHLTEAPLATDSAFRLVFEPYMEILFTSADFNNVISAGWIRTGLRYRLDKGVALDLLAEPYVTFDRVHHFFNNRADIKPTLRFQVNAPNLSGSLLVSYLWNTYFARGDFENNPYKNRNEGLRVLAVFGAVF